MPDTITILLSLGAFVGTLWAGYRTIGVRNQHQTLSAASVSGSTGFVDGEEATIEGDVLIDQPANEGDFEGTLTESESPLALLVWRVRRLKKGNKYTVDLEERQLKRSGDTKESGIEIGDIRIDNGMRETKVDPTWLLEKYGGSDLSEYSSSAFSFSGLQPNRAWASPYIYLKNQKTKFPLKQKQGILGGNSGLGINFNRLQFESRAVPEGESLAVHGEIAVEGGDTVIRGSDETPMVISDQGIDKLGKRVRNRMLMYGGLSVGLFALSLYFLTEILSTGVI